MTGDNISTNEQQEWRVCSTHAAAAGAAAVARCLTSARKTSRQEETGEEPWQASQQHHHNVYLRDDMRFAFRRLRCLCLFMARCSRCRQGRRNRDSRAGGDQARAAASSTCRCLHCMQPTALASACCLSQAAHTVMCDGPVACCPPALHTANSASSLQHCT